MITERFFGEQKWFFLFLKTMFFYSFESVF